MDQVQALMSIAEAIKNGRSDEGENFLVIGNKLIQWGWGYITGSGTTNKSADVTFPKPFANIPYVYVSPAGGMGASATGTRPPAGASFSDNQSAMSFGEATTGFSVGLPSHSGATWSSGQAMNYYWLAIGNYK